MPLTGTVDAANARIDLFVDWTPNVGTQTSSTLYRRVGDINAESEYVRGLFGTTLLGEQAYVSDHEAPLDRQIWYVAAATGTTDLLVAGPFTIPSDGAVWLKDPGRPWADLRLDLCANPSGADPCPAGPLVSDTFERTLASGWGTADTGQTWTNAGGTVPGDYSVSGGTGRHTHPAANTQHSSTVPATTADQDVTVTLTAPALATGDSLFTGPMLRFTDTNNYYWARVTFTTSGAVQLAIRRRVAGTETGIGSVITLPFGYTAGQAFRVRFQVRGSLIRARVWPASVAETEAWSVTVTDTMLAAAGNVGVRSLRGTANTNVSPVFTFDDFTYVDPSAAITDDLAWVGFRDKTRDADAGLFPILDKERPADVFARRKDIETSLLFLSRTREAITRVYELFTAGGPLLVQVPAVYAMDSPYGQSDRYYQPATLTEQYLSGDQRKPPRLWSVPATAVDPPVGQPQGTDTANWCALSDTYPTYADFTAAGFSWGQVAAGAASAPPTSGTYGGGLYGDGFYGG